MLFRNISKRRVNALRHAAVGILSVYKTYSSPTGKIELAAAMALVGRELCRHTLVKTINDVIKLRLNLHSLNIRPQRVAIVILSSSWFVLKFLHLSERVEIYHFLRVERMLVRCREIFVVLIPIVYFLLHFQDSLQRLNWSIRLFGSIIIFPV